MSGASYLGLLSLGSIVPELKALEDLLQNWYMVSSHVLH